MKDTYQRSQEFFDADVDPRELEKEIDLIVRRANRQRLLEELESKYETSN